MKIIKFICAVLCSAVFLTSCSENSEETESSAVEVSVAGSTLTAYEKKALGEAVEIPLENACTTLYECVCRGYVTKSSIRGKFSFADSVPDNNASPSQKIKTADLLTLRNAVEYFGLGDIYTDENIKQYGYMTVSYNDANLIQGTVINISAFERLSEDYERFESMDTKLGDFINNKLLLLR